MRTYGWPVLVFLLTWSSATAQNPRPVPDLRELVLKPQSEMADVVRRFEADRGSLQRTYTVAASPTRHARMHRFYFDWLSALENLKGHEFSKEAQADYAKLMETVQRELKQLDEQRRRDAEAAPLLPFAGTIVNLEESRRRMERVDSEGAATRVHEIKKQIDRLRQSLETSVKSDPKSLKISKPLATAAADTASSLRTTLKNWFNFYNLYDPLFTWWMAEPYKEADQALGEYVTFLRDRIAPMAGAARTAEAPRADAPTAIAAVHSDVPDLLEIIRSSPSEMRPVIARFSQDRMGTGRMANMPNAPTVQRSPERMVQLRKYYVGWLDALAKLDFDKFSQDARVDYLLLRNAIQRELRRLDLQAKAREEMLKLLPFDAALSEIIEGGGKKEKLDAAKAAEKLKSIREQVESALKALDARAGSEAAGSAARQVPVLKAGLVEWYDKAAKGDDKWSAAVKDSYRATQEALDRYAALLRERAGGAKKDESGIEGRPIGREALLAELAFEMIPYTPEELVAIAHREYSWCEAEMKKASRDMGFGDDWRKAVEKVKNLHVEPGRQPELIRDLAREAADYLHKHDLVTVPPLCDETWREEMMTPQRQLYSPFFTGGEVISIAFPTNTMSHEAKLQSLRGNNIHFSRATVHHELIPGHHLQGFMASRYKSYRQPFNTSFWTEGGALYWEFVLYDMGFPRAPEDKVGFLFWRMHRCARIIFSLNYHLGVWTPKQCIDFLVDKVAHERENATAEVRRSFSGGYGPLYQLSYMMGGQQLWALRKELVDSGKMTERQYHDAILKENRIPIAMVRASLTKQKLTRDWVCDWKFYGPNPTQPAKRSETP